MWHSAGLFPTGTTPCRAQPQQRLTPLGHSHSYRNCLQGDNPVRNSQERGHVKTWCCAVRYRQGHAGGAMGSCPGAHLSPQPVLWPRDLSSTAHPVMGTGTAAQYSPCSSAGLHHGALAAMGIILHLFQSAWHLLLSPTTASLETVWICYTIASEV